MRIQRVLKRPIPAFDPFVAVLAFHQRFGLEIGDRPALPPAEVVALRRRLIGEELAELDAALAEGNIVQVADALADFLYVTCSAAISCGIDLRPIFAEVHRTNLAKGGGSKRSDGKVLKPDDWQSPKIAPLLKVMRLGSGSRRSQSASGSCAGRRLNSTGFNERSASSIRFVHLFHPTFRNREVT